MNSIFYGTITHSFEFTRNKLQYNIGINITDFTYFKTILYPGSPSFYGKFENIVALSGWRPKSESASLDFDAILTD